MPAHKKSLTTAAKANDLDTIPAGAKRSAHPRKRKVAKRASPPMRVIDSATPAAAGSPLSTPASPKPLDLAASSGSQPSRNQRPRPASTADWPIQPLKPRADRTGSEPEPADKAKPAPPPLIRTRYNQTSIKRVIVFVVIVAALGGGITAWDNRDWLFPTVQRALKPPVTQLHVNKETVNQAKLAAIMQASQASTPANATAAANLKPSYLDGTEASKPTAELFTDLKTAQTNLANQHINDNGSLQHYLDLATAAQNRHDDATARTQLLNGLELAKEMQILHDYYKK